MLTALIAPIASIVISTSAGVAVDSAVKMLVPIGIKALPAFGIKVGTAIVGGLVGMKIASVVSNNIEGLIEAVSLVETPEVTPEEED
jgi:hypothetical protein